MLKCDRNARTRVNKEEIKNRGDVLWTSCKLVHEVDQDGNRRVRKVAVQGTRVNADRKIYKLGKKKKKTLRKWKHKLMFDNPEEYDRIINA